jgi:hypothetical protein
MPIYILAMPTIPVPDTRAVALPHSRMGNAPKLFQFPNTTATSSGNLTQAHLAAW